MKNAVLSLAALAFALTVFSSCKKELSFGDRLVGRWSSTQVTVGGVDATASYTFDLNLEGSREFDLDVTSVVPLSGRITQSYKGDWAENEARKDITLNYNNGDKKTWDIVELSETTLTAEIIESNTRYQVKFKRN